ncbi:MAG: Ig-like domain-containing protein [Terracidiphilus sp.]
MRAMRRAEAIVPVLLAAVLVPALAGCGNFWEPPGGYSTGTTPSTTTLSALSSSITAGGTDTLTATVSPSAATGTVNFLNNGTSIGTGTLTSGTASYVATFSTAGTETLTATYQGDSTYASSTSSAVTVTVTAAAAGASVPVSLSSFVAARETNLVLDPANPWSVTANAHLHNVAGVALSNGTVENIDGDGHCVYYSGKVYLAAGAHGPSGASNANGVYELSGRGYLAPEGTTDLDCE